MFSSKTDNWSTPKDFFLKLVEEFWEFDLDPAADEINHKAKKYFTREMDGLSQPWEWKVFCNPPYGRELGKWVEKCSRERERESIFDMFTHTRENWYEIFSRFYLQSSGRRGEIYPRPSQILRLKKLRTFSVNARNF